MVFFRYLTIKQTCGSIAAKALGSSKKSIEGNSRGNDLSQLKYEQLKNNFNSGQALKDQIWSDEVHKTLANRSQPLQMSYWSLSSTVGHRQTPGTGLVSQESGDGAPDGMTVIGFIDKYSFTRECIAMSLQAGGADLRIIPHASCAEVLKNNIRYDLLVFHWHDEDIESEKSELASEDFQAITSLGPVIVLGTVEQSELILNIFEKGVRGYVAVRSTPAKLVIEGIRFVKAGGAFGLPLHDVHAHGEPAGTSEIREFTPREKAVLKFLKRGKTNKAIAYELKLSESTVKAHVCNIMKKMNVKNRTEVVCHVYASNK